MSSSKKSSNVQAWQVVSTNVSTPKPITLEVVEKKEEKKEEKESETEISEEKDLDSKSLQAVHMGYIRRIIASRRIKGKGGPVRNAVYSCQLNFNTFFTASAGQVVSGAPRYGNSASYPAFSVFSSVFSRYRIVHVEVYVTNGYIDSSSSGTPHNLVIAANVGDNSGTPLSLSAAWEIPGSRLVSPGMLPNGVAEPVKAALRFKVFPEQDWLECSTDTQKGCLPFYGDGWTASVGTCIIWVRSKFEFSGIVI